MKKLIISLILFLQFCLLFALQFYFNQRGVIWSDIAAGDKLQAVRTSAGNDVIIEINSKLKELFDKKLNEFEEPQFVLKEIENSKNLCIMEITVVDTKSSSLQKSVYELWVLLHEDEPVVYMKDCLETQDFDYLLTK